MKELRLHREVYGAGAVEEAVSVFTPHARIERSEEEDVWVLRVHAKRPALERRIAGELGNYALGLTLRSQGGV